MGIQFQKNYELYLDTVKYFEKASENLILFNIATEANLSKFDSRPLNSRYDFDDVPPLDTFQ